MEKIFYIYVRTRDLKEVNKELAENGAKVKMIVAAGESEEAYIVLEYPDKK